MWVQRCYQSFADLSDDGRISVSDDLEFLGDPGAVDYRNRSWLTPVSCLGLRPPAIFSALQDTWRKAGLWARWLPRETLAVPAGQGLRSARDGWWALMLGHV